MVQEYIHVEPNYCSNSSKFQQIHVDIKLQKNDDCKNTFRNILINYSTYIINLLKKTFPFMLSGT